MDVIAKPRRRQGQAIVPPRKPREGNREEGMRVRVQDEEETSSTTVNIDIRKLQKGIVPDSIFRLSKFKFEPQPFGLEEERMAERIIEPSVQRKSLELFKENPQTPMIYGVGSSPDDTTARTFAAYLVMLHLQTLKHPNVVWESLYGGFHNKLLDSSQKPTLLVISNLAPNSTNHKLEKARDLLDKYDDIPRIVVVSGLDPISYMSTRLYMPCNGLFYHSSKALKQKIEVI